MDGSVTVTDTLGGNVDTVSYTDPSPATFTYPYSSRVTLWGSRTPLRVLIWASMRLARIH